MPTPTLNFEKIPPWVAEDIARLVIKRMSIWMAVPGNKEKLDAEVEKQRREGLL